MFVFVSFAAGGWGALFPLGAMGLGSVDAGHEGRTEELVWSRTRRQTKKEQKQHKIERKNATWEERKKKAKRHMKKERNTASNKERQTPKKKELNQ